MKAYPKLGTYRKHANPIKKKHKLTALDFDIIMYASERDMISQYDLTKNISNSVGSVKNCLTYLEKMGFLKLVRKARPGRGGIAGGYTITGKSRNIVTAFYMAMFPGQIEHK